MHAEGKGRKTAEKEARQQEKGKNEMEKKNATSKAGPKRDKIESKREWEMGKKKAAPEKYAWKRRRQKIHAFA